MATSDIRVITREKHTNLFKLLLHATKLVLYCERNQLPICATMSFPLRITKQHISAGQKSTEVFNKSL